MKTDVLFSLPAEALHGAEKIFVLGDFNNWTSQKGFELTIQEDGSASTTIPLEAGKTYHYRFLINDNTWVNDYNAERYESVAGYGVDNCVIKVVAQPGAETLPEEKVNTTKKATASKATATKSSRPAAKSATKKVAAKSGDKKAKSTKTVKAKSTKPATVKQKTKKADSTASIASAEGSEEA